MAIFDYVFVLELFDYEVHHLYVRIGRGIEL